jgi:pyruvate dehydrogenase E2 component (dihydrolipoyllysine-residue acetyltransferase)
MAISVVMPALEMAQETGKLLAWRKKEGEVVTKGEPLLEIETDKAVVDIEAPSDGILAGIKSHEGAVVPVGETIAWIVAPGEQPPASSAIATPTGRTKQEPAKAAAAAPSAAVATAPASILISPKARRLAKEQGIDIAGLRGSGPDGVITTEDVLAAKQSSVAAPKSAPTSPASPALSTIARLMAERTTKSWTTVPHFFVIRDVDAGALLDSQKRIKAQSQSSPSVSPTITDCLISLVARVLERHPVMNATWANEAVRPNSSINISLAIAVNDGVVAPVIQNANKATLAEIATQRAAVTERARAGRLVPVDLSGGTFTISNLGMYKVDAFTAIITPPQAAVLAVGAVSDRVVAVDGKPAVRPVMTLSLSSDHRLIDGARAAAFLNDLVDAIRKPQGLLPL